MRTLPAGNKLPEIRRALDTVKMLCDKAGTGEDLDMNFEVRMGMGRAWVTLSRALVQESLSGCFLY